MGPADQLRPFTVEVAGARLRGMEGGAGPPALLLHGTGGSWRNFDAWLPAIVPAHHAIIPDLPGFGDSPAPRLRPTLPAWAELIAALVRELAITPRTLVGLGLGASVALAYLALGSGQRAGVERLVLSAPPYCPGAMRPPVRWGVRIATAAPVFAVLRLLLQRSATRRWLVRRFTAPGAEPAETESLVADYGRTDLAVLRGLAREMVVTDFRPLLRGLSTPTLALVGDHDPFVTADAVLALERLMPHVRVCVQVGVGHGWPPAAVAEHRRLLTEFLA